MEKDNIKKWKKRVGGVHPLIPPDPADLAHMRSQLINIVRDNYERYQRPIDIDMINFDLNLVYRQEIDREKIRRILDKLDRENILVKIIETRRAHFYPTDTAYE